MKDTTLKSIGDKIGITTQAPPVFDLHEGTVTAFIDVNGTKYAYRSFGAEGTMPLILLQHFTGTIDDWDPVVTNGFAKYFQVVLFDNKGIGASTGETPNTIEVMAKDAISFIKALGFDKVNLLGFSMGGFIAQQIALYEPGLVNKIILAGTGPRGGEGIAEITKPLTVSAAMDPIEQKLFLFYGPTPSSRMRGRESLTRINKRTVNRAPSTSGPSIQAQLASILQWAKTDTTFPDKLKQLGHPILIVNGNDDIVVPTVNSYAMFNYFDNARLALYPDSGHGSIYQFPELFLAEAIPFLMNN
jgi:pimeloyl-ACP methyl ester carboxylesterase